MIKTLTAILLLIVCTTGHAQTTYDKFQNLLIKNDSTRLSNYIVVQSKTNSELAAATTQDIVKIDTGTGKSYLKVRSGQVSVDIPTVTEIVKASIPAPTPVDLTAILNRLTAAENKIEAVTQENIRLNNELLATKGIAQTALSNTTTLNERLILAEQINNVLATQITALQKGILDSSLSLRTAINTLNTKFNGLNTAVYTRMNSADSKIAALDVRVTKLEAKLP